jgi:hypothetical protein
MFGRILPNDRQLLILTPSIKVDARELELSVPRSFFRALNERYPEERMYALGARGGGGLFSRFLELFGSTRPIACELERADNGGLWFPPAPFDVSYYCQCATGFVPAWEDEQPIHFAYEEFRRPRAEPVKTEPIFDPAQRLYRAQRRGAAAKREQRVRFVPNLNQREP